MTRTTAYAALTISIIAAVSCAGVIAWRLQSAHRAAQLPPTGATVEAKVEPKPLGRPPTIIDAPGDPVLIRRRDGATPPKDVLISVPARLGQDLPKVVAKAHFINAPLVSTTGGSMRKYQESGADADRLAMQLAVNLEESANQTPEQIAAGSDDDGGSDTPAEATGLVLTSANSNQIEIGSAGSRTTPQLKETVLRPVVAEKISDLLIANGYAEEGARMIEAAAKASSGRIDRLPPGAVALAVGALDLTGDYRIKQIAIFENNEYVVTIGARDDGQYDEAAEPVIPPWLLDEHPAEPAAERFTVADGVYSAGLSHGAPEGAVREAIQLVRGLADLRAPLAAGESVRLLYENDFRDMGKSAGRVVYVGLRGGALTVDCYAFEGSVGLFRCFDPNSAASRSEAAGRTPADLGSSGATSVGGILAPIKGAPVTSLFGMRFHPILHILRLHAGLDFGASVDSPVRAAADGTVEFAGAASGFGNHIRIQHDGYETSYSHLSVIPEAIAPGVKVKQGDIIGLSGNTGLSTGPHLHFEYYRERVAVDPLPYLGSEVQSTAARLGGSLVMSGAGASAPAAATSAEIESFHALKAYLDAKIAEML